MLYTLEEECIKQGHTYLPINVVIDLTVDVLNYQDEEVIKPEKLDEMLQYLNEEKRLIIDNEQVAIPSLYYSEIKSVQNLFRIKTHTNKLTEIEQSDLQMHIGEIGKCESSQLCSFTEKEALQTAINSKVMLLTVGARELEKRQ